MMSGPDVASLSNIVVHFTNCEVGGGQVGFAQYIDVLIVSFGY